MLLFSGWRYAPLSGTGLLAKERNLLFAHVPSASGLRLVEHLAYASDAGRGAFLSLTYHNRLSDTSISYQRRRQH